jgi:hypothetical protein
MSFIVSWGLAIRIYRPIASSGTHHNRGINGNKGILSARVGAIHVRYVNHNRAGGVRKFSRECRR